MAVTAATETWRPALGGSYEVSDLGRVRRAKPGRGRTFVGFVLKPHQNNWGYLTISVWEDGRRRRRLVHRLVAEAFLGPCPDGMEVNHRDDDRTNNAASNLEYLTHADNIRHGYRLKRGGAHPAAKLTDADRGEVRRRRADGERGVDLAREYGVSSQTICDITSNRRRV